MVVQVWLCSNSRKGGDVILAVQKFENDDTAHLTMGQFEAGCVEPHEAGQCAQA